MWSAVSVEDLSPARHPIRRIRKVVDTVLEHFNIELFSTLTEARVMTEGGGSRGGRPLSVAGKKPNDVARYRSKVGHEALRHGDHVGFSVVAQILKELPSLPTLGLQRRNGHATDERHLNQPPE